MNQIQSLNTLLEYTNNNNKCKVVPIHFTIYICIILIVGPYNENKIPHLI